MVYLFSNLDVYISTGEKTKLKGFLLFFIKKHVYENKYHSIRLYSLGLHFLLITWPCVIVQWFTVWSRLSLGCCFRRCCQGRCNSWWRAWILSQPLQQFSWAMAFSAYQLEHWMKKKWKEILESIERILLHMNFKICF